MALPFPSVPAIAVMAIEEALANLASLATGDWHRAVRQRPLAKEGSAPERRPSEATTGAARTPESIKRCSCGRSISPDSWRRLPLVGTADNGRGIGEFFELRTCSCGSTIAPPIGVHGPDSGTMPTARGY